MLSDPACLGNLPQDACECLFDPEYWRSRGELFAVTAGRGSAWFIASGTHQWALRHFRRGGFIARLWQDSYIWAGEERVRAFAEWRLLDTLWRQGLPVPRPVAARYARAGLSYRCDLITQRILDSKPLSELLAEAVLPESQWRAVGVVVARLHRAGVDHADLNAHNILIGNQSVSVIDFDRSRLRSPGGWAARNLKRLRRSLAKVARGLPPDRYSGETWRWFLDGYREP